MAKRKFEEYLAPWEIDGDGKKLETAAEIDPEKLKKYLFNLENDKDELQEKVKDTETERDQVKDSLAQVQREHENDEQRRVREGKERDDEVAALRKSDLQRKKIEALEEAFPDATSARIKRLAKRVTSEDEKDWVNDAKELVEDGFRITDRPAGEGEQVEEDLTSRPRVDVRRSNGAPVKTAESGKAKSPAEELDAAGIGHSSW